MRDKTAPAYRFIRKTAEITGVQPTMSRFRHSLLAMALIASGAMGAASAQLLPQISVPQVQLPPVTGPGGVGGAVGGVIDQVGQTVGQTGSAAQQVTRSDVEKAVKPSLARVNIERWIQSAPPATLLDLRRLRLAELVKDNRATLEMDGSGNPTVRGRLLAIDPPDGALAIATRAGFTIAGDERDATLGIRTVTLAIPRGMNTPAAMQLLRRAAPSLNIEFDHIFEPAGGALAASSVALATGTAASAAGRPLIGMIDGGVGQSAALAAAEIEQRGFAGAAQATGHGTAVASLIVGNNGKFRGAAPGASLLVGDVYGGNPAAGSATVVTKALSWLASRRPAVINVSLVGPRNRLVERAVAAVQARGIKVVAAVGNDGPAAPPLYPASQPGVIAVTGVDASNRAIPEAGRAAHLDFAGPGADMAAALPGKGYAAVRGTSFAAPFITSRLAVTGSLAALNAELSKGHGRIGRGIVCAKCRIPPKQVGAK